MSKLKSYMYICSIFLVMLFPVLVYPYFSEKIDLGNYENRRFMSKEDLQMSSWKDFFPNLQLYLDDHMIYKNESIVINNWIDEKIFGGLYNQKVMVGKDEWLFYKSEFCIQDYRGGIILTEAELESYKIAAESLNNVLEGQGKKLVLMITPNKEAIYGERYLPNYVSRYSNKSRADQVVDYLRDSTSLTIVYPKDDLLEASNSKQVWQKYDTHWNRLGAFVATQSFLRELGYPTVDISEVETVDNGLIGGDLSNMIGMPKRFADDSFFDIKGYKDDIKVEEVQNIPQQNLPFIKMETNVANGRSILFIGDSFLDSLRLFITPSFSKSIYVHRDNYSLAEKNMFVSENPDIVVIQTAERFIDSYDDYLRLYTAVFEKELEEKDK